MKFKQLQTKHGTRQSRMQGQFPRFRHRGQFLCAAASLLAIGAPAGLFGPAVAGAAATTSPLEILQHAPKVRFDQPEPTPRPPAPVPYVPPRGPAPVVRPVEPAFTPYAGASVTGPDPAPYYPPPAPPRIATPTLTPRPILGPEDVHPKKKKGFVRGLINAIPFVGGDDDDQPTPSPVSTPPYGAPTVNPAPIYRGYDAGPAQDPTDGPLLLPPGATPLPGDRPGNPEPTSPPIMTPTPRSSSPEFYPSDAPADSTVIPNVSTAKDMESPVPSGAPVLTVKRESDTTTGLETVPVPDPAARIPKQPSVSKSLDEETPIPLERATTSVLIQDSRASKSSLGPEPDSSATSLQPFDPTATPTPTPVPEAPVTEVPDVETSLTIEQADLGMPNPTYEQNTAVLGEFQDSVRKARSEDYAGAAQGFREYGMNHPSSGLAPRAYFLSIVYEKNRAKAIESLQSLERLFPESRYLKEIKTRRLDLSGSGPMATPAAGVLSSETPRQQAGRLEKELTTAVGDTAREPALRKDLGLAYLQMEQYDRAYEVLRPAAEMAAGTALEGEVLLALGRVLVARGETVQAISLFQTVEQKYPALIYKDAASAWSVGLAFEGAGRYGKAREIYNAIPQRWPAAPEAGWATKRVADLASLRQ